MNTRYYPLFALISAVVLLGIFIILLFFGLDRRNAPEVTSTPTPFPFTREEEKKMLANISFSVTPDPSTMLKAQKKQLFTISSSLPFNTSVLQVRVYEKSFGNDSEVERTDITINQSTSTQLTIETLFSLLPNAYYSLRIMQKNTNTPMYTASFQTVAPLLTGVPIKDSDERSLSAYLPRETNSYTLTYNRTRNVYTFHFIFQPELPGSLSSQFEQAKSEAITFIESIGVNPDLINIEWKHS